MKRFLMLLACLALTVPSVGCWDNSASGSNVEKPDADPEAFKAQPGPTLVAPPG